MNLGKATFVKLCVAGLATTPSSDPVTLYNVFPKVGVVTFDPLLDFLLFHIPSACSFVRATPPSSLLVLFLYYDVYISLLPSIISSISSHHHLCASAIVSVPTPITDCTTYLCPLHLIFLYISSDRSTSNLRASPAKDQARQQSTGILHAFFQN